MIGAIITFAVKTISTVAVGEVVKQVVRNNLPIIMESGTRTVVNVGTNILAYVAGATCGDYVSNQLKKSVTIKVTVKSDEKVVGPECPGQTFSAT